MSISARTDGNDDSLPAQAFGVKSAAWREMIAALRDEEKTPLVRSLVGIIEHQAQRLDEQAQRLAALEAELERLQRGPKKPASNRQPSALSKPTVAKPTAEGKRPGSEKRAKTRELLIHEERVVPPQEVPPGSTLVSRDPFVVQDLLVNTHNTRYVLETWCTPTGDVVRGELPAGVRGHFGPGLQVFVLQQHYAAHVPQCRIVEELHEWGVEISAGQVNALLTEQHAAFHTEKDALLPTALQVFTALSVDDSGAPHQGHYGSCLCLANEFFTSFHSSDTKERSKFLDVLRCGHVDYVLNEHSGAYLKSQGLPAKIWRLLGAEAPAGAGEATPPLLEQTFAEASVWNAYLDRLGIDQAKHRQTLTEAALLGSAIAHGVSPDLGIVSDGSAIYAVFVHGLCWIHQERNLAKLTPCGSVQVQALEGVLTEVWQLYADLKAYRAAPSPSRAEVLRARFDALVGRTTGWAELDAALGRMANKTAALLRVLDRPDLPLHTNTAERAFRDWATKRKISAGTRSPLGRRCRDTFLSLKATCQKLSLRFVSYLQDRLTKAGKVLPLPELVRKIAAGPATI